MSIKLNSFFFCLEQQDILPSSVGQLQIIIELALQIFYVVTNDLVELKDMTTMCIKDFLRSSTKKQISDDSTNHDYRMLYQKEFFMQVWNNFILFKSLIKTYFYLCFLGSQLCLHTFNEYSKISRYTYS